MLSSIIPMGQEGKSRLSQPSSSFRLRNRSLNSLRLRRIFDVFDGNGDGVITTPELSRALERLGLDADQAELGRAVECYIKPGKAGLEYDDFESLHRSLGDSLFAGGGESVVSGDEEVESELREAFKVFDEDGDGFISAVELQMVLGKLGLVEGKELEKVEQMINSVDRNRDGQVDFSEFTHMMQGISVQTS